MFVGLHAALAMRTGIAELAITPDEGDQFMTRAQAVMRHYSVETTQKTMDWIAFAGCAGMIYAPRIAAVMQSRVEQSRGRSERGERASDRGDAPAFSAFVPPDMQFQ